MCELQALRIALDMWTLPSRVHYIRSDPLPSGIRLLLCIAAGDDEAERRALALIDRPLTEIRAAAGFFIEQILLAPNSDSYRVLGATPDATPGDLRRNMALLMRWLHPDTDGHKDHHVFTSRVASAWNDLKTTERRAAYEGRLSSIDDGRASRRNRKRHRHKPLKLARAQQSETWSSSGYPGGSLSLLARLTTWLLGQK